MKYRLGKISKRAILEVETGHEYLVFPNGKTEHIEEFLNFLNQKQPLTNTTMTEERQEFYKKFKEANPQTIGEKDKAFDNDNFIDYLVSELSQQKEENEQLKAGNKMFEELVEDRDKIINLYRVDIITLKQEIEALKKERDRLNDECSKYHYQADNKDLRIKELEDSSEFLISKNNYLINGIKDIDWRLKQGYHNLAQVEVNQLLASAYIKDHVPAK